MIKLTSEQKAWLLRWAANYLEQHGEQDTALESLRYCADMTEKYGKPYVIGVDMANGKDESVVKPATE